MKLGILVHRPHSVASDAGAADGLKAVLMRSHRCEWRIKALWSMCFTVASVCILVWILVERQALAALLFNTCSGHVDRFPFALRNVQQRSCSQLCSKELKQLVVLVRKEATPGRQAAPMEAEDSESDIPYCVSVYNDCRP